MSLYVSPATYHQSTPLMVTTTTAAQPSMAMSARPTPKATASTPSGMTRTPTGQSTLVRNTPFTGSPSTADVRQ